MPTTKTTLAQASRSLDPEARARLAALARKNDGAIDFSDQPELTDDAIAAGTVRVVGRGGARAGAGRPRLGKTRKTVKLSPDAVKRFERYARARKLPHFSAAVEAASKLLP